ncbi:MAG: type II CAAX prenyl endopeptidase Rce1 family protein, partial [Planctomycetaceae bacterium]
MILPISRLQIVLGKFAAVLGFSLVTAMLNLVSVGFTSRQILSSIPGRDQASLLSMALPGPGSLALLVALLLPVAGLFSALSLALSCFARSNKEGQYYLSPLLMVGMALAFYCLSPGVELSPQLAIVPIVGPSLMMKTLLSGPAGFEAVRVYLPSVLLSSLLYTGLAVWWACELFQGEAVLFRDSDRFEMLPWLRHQWRTRGWHATLSQALAGFVVLMVLRFFGIVGSVAPPSELSATDRAMALLRQTASQQVWLLGLPALVLACLGLRQPTLGLRWNWPGWRSLCLGGLLAVGLFPLLVWLQNRMSWFFANTPESARDLGQALLDPSVPLAQLVGTIVLAPALCEELAFRGFLLDGLSSRGKAWRGVILSALMFGASHMIPQQVFNATLLGLALGWLTLRTGSLLPAMVLHAVNNSLALVFSRLLTTPADSGLVSWLLRKDVLGPGPTLPVLCLAVACSAAAVYGLSRLPRPARDEADIPPSTLA